jgi:RNA polymerase sigma factor, sigma-70 family
MTSEKREGQPKEAGTQSGRWIDPFFTLALLIGVVKLVNGMSGQGTQDALLELARLAGARDRHATQRLVQEVGPAMLRAVRKVLGHAFTDGEDVLQEAVEGLLLALASFRGECTVLHFACRVAVLTALASRRRASFRAQWALDAPDAAAASTSPEPSPVEGLSATRRRETLGMLLDELPPAQAEVLVFHCALGFTVEEVASAVGRPAETVRSRLRLAKQALREKIEASTELAEILELNR